MPTIELEIPKLHQGQQELETHLKRFNVVPCGRRWGKTQFQIVRAGSPQLVTPNLGTPSAIDASNATNVPVNQATGTLATNLALHHLF